MIKLALLSAAGLILAASAAVVAEPAKVEGKWNVVLQLESITGHPVLTLKQDGEKLTGTYEGGTVRRRSRERSRRKDRVCRHVQR